MNEDNIEEGGDIVDNKMDDNQTHEERELHHCPE